MSSPIRFDDSLPAFAQLVRNSWGIPAITDNLFLRDASGRLTFVTLQDGQTTGEAIYASWSETNTIEKILEAAGDEQQGFLPPFPLPSKGNQLEMLAHAMQRIGLLSYRDDLRIDIPDLFRVAAPMLKKDATPPRQKK